MQKTSTCEELNELLFEYNVAIAMEIFNWPTDLSCDYLKLIRFQPDSNYIKVICLIHGGICT